MAANPLSPFLPMTPPFLQASQPRDINKRYEKKSPPSHALSLLLPIPAALHRW
jgi:hypothetical protein